MVDERAYTDLNASKGLVGLLSKAVCQCSKRVEQVSIKHRHCGTTTLNIREVTVTHSQLTFVDNHYLDILPSLKRRFACSYTSYLRVNVVVPRRYCTPRMNCHS